MAKIQKEGIRVESGGQPHDVKITLPDGTDITQYIRHVRWEMGAEKLPRLWLEVIPFCPADVKGELAKLLCFPEEDDNQPINECWSRPVFEKV